ncbi:unnamed protein product [Acanthoscelides obtectus]|uniref:Uncharacterized protein n=1 Tax=Acanthoscelides obtectus TaxID=200917 RepID=A0A9P0JR41_ACAOB|nr:unnamed protein product [Acanthoscelides obtectus]CAH2001177.1 unnamed protein product [Acanthoscelides obtectus]CAK1665587.1 hypothetical protein AOBTE_LOCUS24891 [Acanthoscelides obtectus]CAK1665648.1 hypothetical protein AOBTE_LOCUS24910 [Acanthoscelides obtectus]
MVNETFSSLMLIYMGVVTLIICIEIYTMITMDSTADILAAILYAAQMFFEFFICYCFPAQDLTNEAELLSVTMFGTNWYLYPAYYKDMMLFLGKSRLKVIYSAGGLFDLNRQTGMAALKNMVSYSMFLHTMTQLEAT